MNIPAEVKLYVHGGYWLSNLPFRWCDTNEEVLYFRTGSKELHRRMPTWFDTQAEAVAEAKAQGFEVEAKATA